VDALIYKICHGNEWRLAEREGIYAGSAKDREDHFIHFSCAEQVMATLQRYYAEASDLVLVAVTTESLGDLLKYEPSRDGALFPHLYGTLPMTFVKWVKPILRGANGAFIVPEGVG
jgi:uncharacterized protein (DUF952 family)